MTADSLPRRLRLVPALVGLAVAALASGSILVAQWVGHGPGAVVLLGGSVVVALLATLAIAVGRTRLAGGLTGVLFFAGFLSFGLWSIFWLVAAFFGFALVLEHPVYAPLALVGIVALAALIVATSEPYRTQTGVLAVVALVIGAGSHLVARRRVSAG